MKINLNSLAKFSNPEKYKKVIGMIDNNRKNLEDNKAKYSDREDYDKIVKLHEENKNLVENFRIFLSNKELLMEDILEIINKHQESFIKNSNIKELSKMLGVDSNICNENYSTSVKNLNEIYAKVQENSNIIIVYDIEKKKFHQILHENKFFNAKSFSYYINETKTIFVSGGIKDFTREREYRNDFYKIKIKINYDDFEFELIELPSMLDGRASHSMIQYGEYLMVIGGLNTKTCEIFDMKANQWSNLPELQYILANPALALVNNILYVFSGSGSLNSFDGIYKLSLNNLSRVVNREKGFENILDWERLDYMYKVLNTEKVPRLRRGMAALPMGDNILLLGGFDYDNIYDDMYLFHFNLDKVKPEVEACAKVNNEKIVMKKDVNVKGNQQEKIIIKDLHVSDDEEQVVKKNEEFEPIDDENIYKISDTDVQLPIKTFFNSNLLLFDYYLIMIDGFNNAIEFNLKTQEFYYYT